MEFLNKIEIRGIVGRIELQSIGDATYARFSVMTEHAYTTPRNGMVAIDTTWHDCSRWVKPEEYQTYRSIGKGDTIHLTGRIKNTRYNDENGHDHIHTSIAVAEVLSVEHKK